MTKAKPFVPKPIKIEALPAGSKNPSYAAHQMAVNDANKQLSYNTMAGGNPATIPQAPMYGMKSQPGDANTVTVAGTNQRAQIHENASYDDMVGKVASGGSKKRKNTSSRKKRTKRKYRKRRAHKRKSIKNKRKKRTRRNRKNRRNRK